MNYTKKHLLGQRSGRGTFDCFFDTNKYSTYEDADKNNDLVVVDFVEDDIGVRYFEIYHSQKPDDKKYHRLEIQHFPAGIDVFDDNAAFEISKSMFL